MWDGMSKRPGLSPRLPLKHLDDQETKRKKNAEQKENLKTQGKTWWKEQEKKTKEEERTHETNRKFTECSIGFKVKPDLL